MKVLVCKLVYGNRSHDILTANEIKAGYNAYYCTIDTEGISNALNDGIEFMMADDYDAIAFLSNDIEEPQDWLAKKVEALKTYPNAGIVASSLDNVRTEIKNELIISNWLISRQTIEKIGYFNESMFPYGPIDLDYCERCYAAGIKTYYVLDCLALHIGSHASGDEYGWNKEQLIAEGWSKMFKQGQEYYKNRL